MSTKERNLEIKKENQNNLRELEQFYVEGKIDNMLSKIEERKNELVEDMIEYAKNNKVVAKYNNNGDPVAWEINIKPIVVANYFLNLLCQ